TDRGRGAGELDIPLVNARGDKEAVFMAAGAGLDADRRAVALLHGARGLTNAAGAVADVSSATMAAGTGLTAGDARGYFASPPGLSYAAVAAGLGMGMRADVVDALAGGERDAALDRLTALLVAGLSGGRPALVEMRLPADSRFWSDIWRLHGLDDRPSP